MIAKDKISFPITNSWYIASFYVANGCTLFGEMEQTRQQALTSKAIKQKQ